MDSHIECYYQSTIKNYKGFDSEFFPVGLEGLPGMQRLKIHAPQGTFENLLEKLVLNIKWVVFSSEPVDGFQRCNLSWLQKWNLKGICDSTSLFYAVSKSPKLVEKVNETILWCYGAGLAIPINDENESKLRKVIEMQTNLKKRLVIDIINEFKCIVLANKDGYGVDVIWNTNWEYARDTLEWAKELTTKYRWEGYPFQ